MRVNKLGEDKRLRQFFPNEMMGETWFKGASKNGKAKLAPIFRLLTFWSIQTIWGLITLSPVYMSQYSKIRPKKIPNLSLFGACLFGIFLLMQSYADFHKFTFKNDPKNAGKFIQSGLYKYSQMPNYFAEMGIWSSIFIMAMPVLTKQQLWCVISPLFTIFLLTKISGAPMLESGWEKKYGKLEEFRKWRKNTNRFIPWFPRNN